MELIAFVAPVTEYELEMIRQNGRWPEFQHWKRFVADHIDYTDFSGYNGVARSDRMFIDAWHMEPAVGAVIMRRLLGLSDCDCADAAVVWNSALPMTAHDADTMAGVAGPADGGGDRGTQRVLDHRCRRDRQALRRAQAGVVSAPLSGAGCVSFGRQPGYAGSINDTRWEDAPMPTYVMLFHLTHQGLDHLKGSPDRVDAALKTFERHGAKVKDFYSMMGQYDSMFIVEAPDDETVARLALTLGAQGNVRSETHRAFSLAEYRALIAKAG